jgi:hypothetical protein
MKRRNDFREQLERRRKQAESSPVEAETDSKTTEEMSDEEISFALAAARREILDLQHEELREREKARVTGGGDHDHTRSLPDKFRKRPNFR